MQRILSLGAGIQSTAVALMSTDGTLPPLDHAIFSDTGWEPQGVYDHLERLTTHLEAHGTQVHRVSWGNLRDDTLAQIDVTWIPFKVGRSGIMKRQCTENYKLLPLNAKVRQILGASTTIRDNGREKVGRLPWSARCELWVGISTDEIERVRPSRHKYMQRVDPLVDWLDMTRADCEGYLAEHWPHPVERSACIGCPYRSNGEWVDMQINDRTSWDDAVSFDAAVREMGGVYSDAYLHNDRIPLGDIDFASKPKAAPRPGCSPWGCASEE